MRRIDTPGRGAAFEIIISTPSIRDLETHLKRLYESGAISHESALDVANAPNLPDQQING